MIYDIKHKVLKGVSQVEVAKIMRNKFPRMRIISSRYEVNFGDIAKANRIQSERLLNVYFIDNVDQLINKFEENEANKDE